MIKSILFTIFFLFAVFTLSNITTSNAEHSTMVVINSSNNAALLKEVKALRKKVLTQRIELESEIIIPDYIDIKYIEYMDKTAKQLKLSTRMVFRLIYTESRFNDTLISCRGAKGLMQLMPDTRHDYYELLRVDTLNLDRNKEDIYIGLNYLKDMHDFWRYYGNSEGFSWKLSLASYNSGKGNVIKYKNVPPYKETIEFVNFINKIHSNPEFYIKYIKKYENTAKVNS